MTNLRLAGVVAVLGLNAALASGAQPGVDCRKAKSWADRTVCEDDHLLALDARLAELTRLAGRTLTGPPSKEFRDRQKAWLRSREECRDRREPIACLGHSYGERIAEVERLGGVGAEQPPRPPRSNRALEDCFRDAETRAEVGPCLERKLDRLRADLEAAQNVAAAAARDLDSVAGRGQALRRFQDACDAWERYRDAECSFRREMVAGGTGADDIYRACLVELTQERLAQLRR